MAENENSKLNFRHHAKSTKVVPFEVEENGSDRIEPKYHDETPIYRALRSLHISMLLSGLVFAKDFSKSGIKRHLTVSHVYSFTVLVFLTINTLRWLSMFRSDEQFGATLFMKIVDCVWSLETLAHYVAFFLACESYKRLPEFFVEWEKIRMSCSRSVASITRLSNICTAIMWIIITCNVGFCAYMVLFTDMQNMALTPWDANFKYAFVIRIVNLILLFYLSVSWVASSAFMFTICKILAFEFNKVSCTIKKLSLTDPAKLVTELEAIRQKHQKLCNLVENADDIFSMQIAYSFSGSMLVACLMIYIVIYDGLTLEGGVLWLFIQCFWAVVPIVKVVMDCVSGAIVNGAVRLGIIVIVKGGL